MCLNVNLLGKGVFFFLSCYFFLFFCGWTEMLADINDVVINRYKVLNLSINLRASESVIEKK